jgi:hypothetical protein
VLATCMANRGGPVCKDHSFISKYVGFFQSQILVTLTVQPSDYIVRFVVFTAVTMKNGVFWDVTPCGSCKNRRFGGT